MAANTDRGEIDVRIGGQTRTLRFRAPEVALLEEKLDSDPLTFLGNGRGQVRFLIAAIWAGLSRIDKAGKHTPPVIAGWLDDDKEPVNREELQKEILYAIARGKPGDEAKEMVRQLDLAFSDVDAQTAKAGDGPLVEGSQRLTIATS